MSCGLSRETLALHVEGDLPEAAAAAADAHLAACPECRRFVEALRASQALLKSAGREMVSPADCSAMRREVMAIISERPGALGWAFRVERALALGLRPSYGIAALLLLGIVSVSVLAQIRAAPNVIASPATLGGADTLMRPEGYRAWTMVSAAAAEPGRPASGGRVYVSPAIGREYARTGIFPEGTVFVWEAGPEGVSGRQGPHAASSTLLVSVKDSAKFAGGWGFFDFSGPRGPDGAPPATARELAEAKGCRACHRQSARSDHVFSEVLPGRGAGLRPGPVSLG